MKLKLACATTALLFTACASAPKQTVELAEAVNQQIAHMQTSHEEFVRLYYSGLRSDVDEFMAQKWTPQFLSNVISGQGEGGRQFRAELDRGYALAKVDWADAVKIEGIADSKTVTAIKEAIEEVAVRERGELGRVLIDFSNEAQRQISLQRRKLLDPIEAQEAFVLRELRAGYADLLAGSSSIRGYLASVVKVTENRDAVVKKIGLLDEQRSLLDSAISANEDAMNVLGGSKDLKEGVNAAVAKLKDWLNRAGKATK